MDTQNNGVDSTGPGSPGGIRLSTFPYMLAEKIEDSQTAWYFVENAAFSFPERHRAARAFTYPLPRGPGFPETDVAYYGHEIEKGSGLVISRRQIERGQEPFGGGFFRIEHLTIYVPAGLDEPTGRIQLGGGRDDGPFAFWSVWGHDFFKCFAYATSGTIDYKRLPAPSHVGSKLSPDLKDEPYVRTLAADLGIDFDQVFDESSPYEGDEDPLCPSFSIRESLEFYWRPVGVVVKDFQ